MATNPHHATAPVSQIHLIINPHHDPCSFFQIYLTGHGGDEFLKFQDVTELMAQDLADGLATMAEQRRWVCPPVARGGGVGYEGSGAEEVCAFAWEVGRQVALKLSASQETLV
jgi:hypothetical protein